MTTAPAPATVARAPLDAEWTRVGHLVTLAEVARTGGVVDDAFADSFDAASAGVTQARSGGAWAGLAELLAPEAAARLDAVDLDILAIALVAEARPMIAGRLHSLQPQVGGPHPSLGLLQELLLLDSEVEVDRLYARLGPTSPLVAHGLVRVSGVGAYQTVRPTPAVAMAVLGRATDLSPPPGAHLVTARAGWHDLILPSSALRSLVDFTSWTRFAAASASNAAAPNAGGPLALFCGPSGTGKSLAALVIASHLEATTGEPWVLYALDLGRIMSKYVGETEQNLNALLDALHGRRAILQIDEADGLLGKRGEVSDARDRYANLEVSHMLSRFERHAGPVILTTNLRANIDSAFLRRFQLIVDFPSPDAEARTRLWETLLPTPREAKLDFAALGEGIRLSGGGIRNAATYAAILAAEAARPIGLPHLARAIWAEINKDNRQVRITEIGFLADHLDAVSP